MTCPEFIRRRRIYRRIFGRINSLQHFDFTQRCIKSTILYPFVQPGVILTEKMPNWQVGCWYFRLTVCFFNQLTTPRILARILLIGKMELYSCQKD
jgi:hypothetical protein